MGATKVIEENTTIEVESSPSTSRWIRLGYVLNTLNQMLIGFVTIYMSWECLRIRLRGVALHTWLCTIGFSFLMAEGVMTHYASNTLLLSYSRKSKNTVHWILQALGGGIGIAGGIIKMCQMETHFKTLHGNLGFAAMIISAVSMLSGLSALFAGTLRHVFAPLLNKSVHNLLGIGAFVTALVAQYYGYQTGGFKPWVASDLRYMIEVITLSSLVLSCLGPLLSLWNKCVTYLQ